MILYINCICEKCTNYRDDETPRCGLGYWEGIDPGKENEYDHKWDDCKKFNPNPYTYHGLLHIISITPDTWIPALLIYIVEHGYRNDIFVKPNDALNIIKKTGDDYLDLLKLMDKAEESIKKQNRFKLKRRKKSQVKLRRRKTK